MTLPWWLVKGAAARLLPEPAGSRPPQLVDPSARAHLLELLRRAPAFVPEWVRGPGDAGEALVRLFGAQLQPLLERVNRLPEKSFVEFLRLAGIQQLPGGTAAALLVFSATDGAPQAALVPQGFQVGAPSADGSEGLVIFETTRPVSVVPGTIEQALQQTGRTLVSIAKPTDGTVFRPFGDRAIAGRAFLIGIKSSVQPQGSLSLGFMVAAAPGAPPPASAGGLQPAAMRLPPILQWDVLDGASFVPVEVIADETAGLANSGVIELRPPQRWRVGRPMAADGGDDLYWLRVRIVHGSYDEPPQLSRLALNAVRAVAAETIFGETLEHVPRSDNRMRLARTPVIPLSIELDVQEGAATGDLLDPERPQAGADTLLDVRRWTEAADLSAHGPNDRVFTLDPASGEVTFGDGHHGAALPPGFRHVTAARYRVGGGRRGAVGAGDVATLVSSVPFLRGVTNPERASGGTDLERRAAALARGPEEVRTRGRAVTERDYELLARRSPGAAVARARAVSGFHPVLGGAPVAGVVGVFVIPAERIQGPPVADEATLRAVATHLARDVAPAGVEVVAAAARFHRIRAALRVQVGDGRANHADVVRRVIEELDAYFDPIRGGDEGTGWAFGGVVRFMPLLRRLLSRVTDVSAVPRLNLIVDGTRFPSCADVPISRYGLLWPESHEVSIETPEGTR